MRILSLIIFLAVHTANAQIIPEPKLYAPTDIAIVPERSIENIYPGSPQEDVLQAKNAKALKFDFPLLRRDFPFMKSWTNDQIFNFWEKIGGLVSTAQAGQQTVNTYIETATPLKKNNSQVITWEWEGQKHEIKFRAFRPPGYGRAIVIEFDWGGETFAFEVKMSGVAPGRHPHQGPHGNGVGTLGEVIREDQFENATRASIKHAIDTGRLQENSSGVSLKGTVAGYGILYAGYDVRHSDGSTSPAGIYIRQAHKRMNYDDNVRAAWLPGEVKGQILNHISLYGFYTGWESNIQGLIKGKGVYLFDYGHWIAWQGFVHEANRSVDPSLAVNFNNWGWESHNGPNRERDQWSTSKLDRPWNWAHGTADSIKGPNGQTYLAQHYDTMLGDLFQKLHVGVQAPAVLSCKNLFR